MRMQMHPTPRFKAIAKVAIAASAILFSANGFTFGTDGHQTIALIALPQLTTKARSEVDRLLALEPGATLASVSTWADEHRSPATASWHYVNFPRTSCEYDAARDCPGGACVVGAIEKQLDILASNAPDETRLTALKYVVHFVGDVHQPLHAGYQDDKGGNTYQVQAFSRGSNLHSLWDSGLIKNLHEEPAALATRLLKTNASSVAVDTDPSHAAQESCRIVGAADFYPDRKVGTEYVEKYTPVVEQRLTIAGQRLAAMLNRVLR